MSDPHIDPEKRVWHQRRHLLGEGKKIRCIAMDGGGLYGLTQAIWLRKMCLHSPHFLKQHSDDIHLFVGTSAGAVNALLLAQAEDPRELVLSRRLEQFWKEPGFFVNRKNPVHWALSNLFITPWLGTEDAFDQLNQWFGSDLMRDLKHPVIVSTYNWAGGKPIFPPEGERSGFKFQPEHWFPRGARLGLPGVGQRWQPYFFNNFLCHADGEYRLADVAFAATAMPAVRSLRGGIGDGGIFNANPSMDAIALLVHAMEQAETGEHPPPPEGTHLHTNGGDLQPPPRVQMPQHVKNMSALLTQLHMLSLGNGAIMPYYHTKNCDYGALPWNLRAVNSAFGPFRPNSYMLNQALQEAELDSSSILGNQYLRFNPGVMAMPPGPVLYFVRNDRARDWLIQQIESNIEHGATWQMMPVAENFLNHGWTRPVISPPSKKGGTPDVADPAP